MQHKNLIDGSRDILHGIQERCQHTGYQARNISHATAEKSSHAARTVRDYAGRKLDEMTEQFNKDLPLIEKGGYTLTGVEIDVGISPQFSCRFSIQDDTTAEQREAARRRPAEQGPTNTAGSCCCEARTHDEPVDHR